MSKPRASVLALFDPLSAIPDEVTNEEKETTGLDAELERRLVDVGDVLVQINEEDEDTGVTPPRTPTRDLAAVSQRSFLGELALVPAEHSTPLAHKRQRKRREPPSSSPEQLRNPPKKISAPRESTFTQIINAIEATGLPFSAQPPRILTLADIMPRQPQPQADPSHEVVNTPDVPAMTYPPHSYPDNFLDSFYNQIQVPDVSFDLVHDEISLAPENSTDGHSVEKSQTKNHHTVPPCPKFGFGTPLALARQRIALESMSPVAENAKDVHHPTEPAAGLSTPTTPAKVDKPSTSSVVPQRAAVATSSKPAAARRQMVTPVQRGVPVVVPPPVQALRIVKRVKRLAEKPATSAESSQPSISAVPKGSTSTTTIRANSVRQPLTKPTGSLAASRPPVPEKAGPAATKPSKLGAPITTGNGPKRVLVTDPSAPGNQLYTKTSVQPPARVTATSSGPPTSASSRPNNGLNPSRLPAPSGVSRAKLGTSSGASRNVARRGGVH